MAIAFWPIGVEPPGVIITGVMEGVALGVIDGVAPPGVIEGVAPPGVIDGVAPGVSSHLDLLLLADGVGVSEIILSPGWTDRGVSAQPAFARKKRYVLHMAPEVNISPQN